MINYLDDLYAVKDILLDNKVILSPTDTVWGLGCNSFSLEAIQKIRDIKQRDDGKPFILLVDSIQQLKLYVESIHPRIETLLHYHERPLSVIYKASAALPSHLSTEEGTVAIRVTKEPILKELIQMLGKPLVSTSANIQSMETPQNYEDLDARVLEQVDYVFKTGRKVKNKQIASMLIAFDDEGELIFLRK